MDFLIIYGNGFIDYYEDLNSQNIRTHMNLFRLREITYNKVEDIMIWIK